ARPHRADKPIRDRRLRYCGPGNPALLPGSCSRCPGHASCRPRRRTGPDVLPLRRTPRPRPAPRPGAEAPMMAGSSRQRMRRHARRLRRYGLEPIAIVNPGDPLPEIAAVVIGRWLWRYRSELAPAALALATLISAWLLHRFHPGWWLLAAGTTLALAAAPF